VVVLVEVGFELDGGRWRRFGDEKCTVAVCSKGLSFVFGGNDIFIALGGLPLVVKFEVNFGSAV